MSRPEDGEYIEDLLRRREKSARRAGGPHCGDPEMLAAFAEDALSGTAREQFEAHLAACSACQEAVARLVRLAPRQAVVQPVPKPSFLMRFVPALAGFLLVGSLIWYGRERIYEQPQQNLPAATVAENRKPAEPAPTATPKLQTRQLDAGPPVEKGALAGKRDARDEVGAKEKDAFAPAPPEAPKRADAPAAPALADYENKLKQEAQNQRLNQAASAPAPSAQNVQNMQNAQQRAQNEPTQAKAQAVEEAAGKVASTLDRDRSADRKASAPALSLGLAKKLADRPSKNTALGWNELDAQRIWALNDDGALFYSSTAGRIWLPVATPEPARAIAFENDKTGQITARSGRVYRTADGGKNWEKKE